MPDRDDALPAFRMLKLSEHQAWCCGFANRRPDGSVVQAKRDLHLDRSTP